MALIGTLRNKMGIGVIIFVGLAIASFTLSDLLGNNSILLGQDNNVGEIAGNTINLEEYQAAVQEREANYFLNFGREAGEAERPLLQQQAWEMLIVRNAIEKQYKSVGVEVTSEEVWDMIQGKNVDPNLKSTPLFLNDATGQFDKDKVVSYLQNINMMPAGSEQRVRWELFQRDLAPGRQRLKYENLLVSTNYVTKAEAEKEYHLQTDVAEVKYLYVPYYSVKDSAVSVSESDLKNYYNKNKEKYKTEHVRELSYVAFPVIPSREDSVAIRQDLVDMINDLSRAESDSIFAIVNADTRETAFQRLSPAELPTYISPNSIEGTIIGPFIDGESYKVVKVSAIGKDTIYNAKASHILFRWTDESEEAKKEAKEEARKVLAEIKAGADFAAMAREHGTDGTASSGGDLGWFSSGGMVKSFEDAVFGATKTGPLNDVVETEYGYHIIDVTGLKDNTYYSIAEIDRAIVPSDASINEALRKAELFSVDLKGVNAFKEKAKAEGLIPMDAKTIGVADRRIGTLGEARQIVQWLFRNASVGKVSDVFDLNDQYVVAVMTGELEKGYKPFEVVKEEITPAVKNEKKAAIITEKLKGLEGSLDEVAVKFGDDAAVYTNNSLKLNTNSMPTVGFDPKSVGVAFSLESGSKSKTFAGENGVVIIEMLNKTTAPAIADFTVYKTQLLQTARNQSYNIGEAIKEKSDIVDERYKFY